MVFNSRQAEEVFERALELDNEGRVFDRLALQRLADELGVSESAMSRAIDEAVAGRPGPRNAIASAVFDAPASEVEAALDSFLRLRGLCPVGATVWAQGSGWWPDLHRFTAATPVAVLVNAVDGGSMVRLTAGLDRVWRAHLVAALLAPVVVLLSLVGIGPSLSSDAALVALSWIAAAAWTYRQRREAVRRRLARALVDISHPGYRLQPW